MSSGHVDPRTTTFALLSRTKDLIPMASSSACERLFQRLAVIAANLASLKNLKASSKFAQMTLEELIAAGLTSLFLFFVLFFFFHRFSFIFQKTKR